MGNTPGFATFSGTEKTNNWSDPGWLTQVSEQNCVPTPACEASCQTLVNYRSTHCIYASSHQRAEGLRTQNTPDMCLNWGFSWQTCLSRPTCSFLCWNINYFRHCFGITLYTNIATKDSHEDLKVLLFNQHGTAKRLNAIRSYCIQHFQHLCVKSYT